MSRIQTCKLSVFIGNLLILIDFLLYEIKSQALSLGFSLIGDEEMLRFMRPVHTLY